MPASKTTSEHSQQDWSDAIAQGILCMRCVLPLEDQLAIGPRLCHWCREEDRMAVDDEDD